MTFILTSPAFVNGEGLPEAQVFNGMGHTGKNLSPALSWSGAPEGTKSLAMSLYDPDAPTGSGWWHWVVVNLPAGTDRLPEGIGPNGEGLPPGAIQTRTDFGTPGYGGAAPPPGAPHRYIFRIHALSVSHLDVIPDMSSAMVGFMVNAHSLGTATLVALYGGN